MSETKQINTTTSVNVRGTALTIYTKYVTPLIVAFLEFFVRDDEGDVNAVAFLEGEEGYTIDGMPNTSFSIDSQGELTVADLDVSKFSLDGLGYLIGDSIIAAPTANEITYIDNGFRANWLAVSSATKYYIDIALDSQFINIVPTYSNKDVGNVTSVNVTGLQGQTGYYYRVRAANDTEVSVNSNIVAFVTVDIVVAGTSPSDLLIKSIDAGQNFTNLGSAETGNILCVCQLDNLDVLFGTDEEVIINTTKGSYVKISGIGTVQTIVSVGDIVYIGGSSGKVYKSIDAGVTFNLLVSGLGGIKTILYYEVSAVPKLTIYSDTGAYVTESATLAQAGNFTCAMRDPVLARNILWAGDSSGNIWKSYNDGSAWTDFGNISATAILFLVPVPEDPIMYHIPGQWISNYGTTQVAYYANVGGSPAVVQGPYTLSADTVTCACVLNHQIVMVGTNAGNLYKSLNHDNGDTWSSPHGNPQQGESAINFLSIITGDVVLPVSPPVWDEDGNAYTYVTIGTQQWLVENLKTTKYNDGSSIPNITNSALWMADILGAYCWYNNDIVNKVDYGALYNWHAINTGKLAPTGWRVPSNNDFSILSTYLGGDAVAGGKMKEMGLTHWLSPNEAATNESGFTGRAGGYRTDGDGSFQSFGWYCNFWTTDTFMAVSKERYLNKSNGTLTSSNVGRANGFSIRCVRDI